METEEYIELYRSPIRGPCADRALVLKALDIPHMVDRFGGEYVLSVEATYYMKAQQEIRNYAEENRDWRPRPVEEPIVRHVAWPGVMGYVLVMLLVGFAAAESLGGENWFQSGRFHAGRVASGEWWRTITALTLHADVGHLISNLGFGALFGYFAGQLLGTGFAWFGILIAATLANGMNAWIQPDNHTSVGASTAVFAALGMVSAAAWIRRRKLDHRWAYRSAPLLGGVLLLAYTGFSGERTDVGAHLAGFFMGMLAGRLYTWIEVSVDLKSINQYLYGYVAIGLVVLAWLVALQ